MSFFHSVKLGNIVLEGNLFLAPMAGYTDSVFRSICLSHEADFAYTEMISAEGLARNNTATKILAQKAENEKYLAIQLFAGEEDVFRRCVTNLMLLKPSLIDLNCGCPVPKVTKTGAGCALMKTPNKIGAVVKVLKEETSLPVTVKIRAGWDLQNLNYLFCAESAFNTGASAVCMHARTKTQLYMPKANYEYLKDLKTHFPEKIIIGSGDLFSEQDALCMFQSTGVDAVCFARGAIGNPFIFEKTRALLEKKEIPAVSLIEKKNTFLFHLTSLAKFKGEEKACREMRKFAPQYFKGIPYSSKIKNLMSCAVTIKEYKNILDNLLCE